MAQAQDEPNPVAHPTLPKALQHISYSGGDGTSCEKAVIIENAVDTKEGLSAEKAWIFWKYPNAKLKKQALSGSGDRFFDVFEIATASGEVKTLCFDITEFFGFW